MNIPPVKTLIASAAAALEQRVAEVDRLNVFPVPDGDTGTNMSLTMQAVVAEVGRLAPDAPLRAICHAVTHASLMGARGNSGVILSQILRGLCEGLEGATDFDVPTLAHALERARDVAYQAVRKPVEGTMLTVMKDVAAAARDAREQGDGIDAALERIAHEAARSVERTPELLPVLKENGVVDAGGFGLALLIEGFVAAALGRPLATAEVETVAPSELTVVPVDDWDDQEYLYCTEFLLFGDDIERERIEAFVSGIGGSELVVGDQGSFKVHVHTNDPGAVLTYMTGLGQVAEVHINNMRRQSAARRERLRAESNVRAPQPDVAPKPIGVVAVASGTGLAEILRSLGADVVVEGGQTMNPSTADLLSAIDAVNAEKVIVLPNNKNIVMAANAAATVSSRPVRVVPTRSVPEAFAALLAWDGSQDIDAVVDSMAAAASQVRTGEVTTAIKDATAENGAIREGQVIGIVDDERIAAVGDSVEEVALELAAVLLKDGAESLTLLAGADLDDATLERIAQRIAESHREVEIETHRGGQPLYPLIMSAE